MNVLTGLMVDFSVKLFAHLCIRLSMALAWSGVVGRPSAMFSPLVSAKMSRMALVRM